MPMSNDRFFAMSFARVYPLERKHDLNAPAQALDV
jgi:hypothetical protein